MFFIFCIKFNKLIIKIICKIIKRKSKKGLRIIIYLLKFSNVLKNIFSWISFFNFAEKIGRNRTDQ